jgi:hypothetical protein
LALFFFIIITAAAATAAAVAVTIGTRFTRAALLRRARTLLRRDVILIYYGS